MSSAVDVAVVAEDDSVARDVVAAVSGSHRVHWISSHAETASALKDGAFPIVIVDSRVYESGGESLAELRRRTEGVSMVVLTDGASLLDLPGTVGMLRPGWSRGELRELLERASLLHDTREDISRRESPCRVLVIDGFPPDALMVRDFLDEAGAGYQVELCECVDEGLKRLAEGGISAVVTELSLPDAQGLDAVAKIHAAAPDVPLLVLCENRDEAMAACAARLGAQSYLVKGQTTAATLVCAIRGCLERKARETDLESRAALDALTGLPNRSVFLEHVQTLADVAERSGEPLAVLVLDLDGFKSVNDSLGHLAGDDVLVQVATRIQSVLRASDFAARVGGDEFVILAPGASNPHILEGRLEAAVDITVKTQWGPLRVTASVGSARYPIDGGTIEEVLGAADRNMYAAKQAKAVTSVHSRHPS